VLAGESDKEIAQRVERSRPTGRSHVERLRFKLGARCRIRIATQVFAAYLAWFNESPPPPGCRFLTVLYRSRENY
jgi:hypothetical protein